MSSRKHVIFEIFFRGVNLPPKTVRHEEKIISHCVVKKGFGFIIPQFAFRNSEKSYFKQSDVWSNESSLRSE